MNMTNNPESPTTIMANSDSQGKTERKRMWPSFETAVWLYDSANIFLVGALAIGVISTFLVVWMGNVKEEYLRRDLSSTNARSEEAKAASAEANARGDEARAGAAIASERASQAEARAAEAKLETEILRKKNSDLELAVSPRVLEQNITGQSLKQFAGTEVAIISPYDFEPRRTAGQIRFMLQSVAGWKKFSGPLPQVAFFEGAVVHSGMGSSAPAKEAVVSVLENNGIVARIGYPIMELGSNGVLIVVGPKPLPASLQLKPENVPADAQGNRIWGNMLEE